MLKQLLVLAFLASFIFTTSCSDPDCDDTIIISKTSNSSSSSSSSSDSSSSSSTTIIDSGDDDCEEVLCGPHEEYVKCPSLLCKAQRCSQLGFPMPCPIPRPDGKCPGKPGCVCVNGYLRNSKGVCVPVKKCPSCGGDPNAQSGCGTFCKRCRGPIPCPRICRVNACDCKPGFVYDDNIKKCVRKSQCTPVCSEGEVFSTCANGGCRRRNCSDLGGPILCIDPRVCKKGCVCKKGYLRDENGVCTTEEECGKKKCKKPNEVYEICPATCPFRTCGIDDRLVFCAEPPKIGDTNCPPPACRCKSGFFRHPNGSCVRWEECPKCTGPHEYFDCSVACDNICATLDTQNKTNCPVINKRCNEMCYCKDGYARDNNNICIPITQCKETEKCKAVNEEWDSCPSNCSVPTCANIGKKYHCPKESSPKKCVGACRCKPNYYKSEIGQCISKKQCRQCKSNEVFDLCPAPCPPRRCDVDDRLIRCRAPPKIGDPECKPGCRCADGLVRNKYGECIPRDQCPPKCGDNEVPSNCTNGGCQARNCSQLGKPVPCVKLDPAACIKGCICAEKYLRADNGTCVPIDKCEGNQICTKPHEVYSPCPPICPARKCGIDDRRVFCPRNPKVGDPNCPPPSCICDSGYYRNPNGDCVTWDECPPICGDNEVPSNCTNGGCQARNCSQLGKPVPCVKLDPAACVKGCICAENYLRADNGTCVPIDKCEVKCNGQNEVWDSCPDTCPPQTCESIGKLYNCPNKPIPPVCKGACRCKPNFFRNKIGQCISKQDCLKCTGPHEYFSCGGACDNLCATLHKQNQTHCPIVNIQCNKKCYCEEGYARNKTGICIPIKDCNKPPVCPDGEIYSECPPIKCDAEYCPKSRNDPLTCPTPTKCGKPRCVCGFNRHRDRVTGKCVPTSQCPPFKCNGPNEKYQACPPVCPGETCTDYINNSTCPRFRIGIVVPCRPQCRCTKDHYRNSDGICVEPCECEAESTTTTTTKAPPKKCTGQNEVWDSCPDICPPQTCESIGKSYSCPNQQKGSKCKGSCRCKPNFFRNKIGQCISKEDCLKCTGPHEYFSCGRACDNVCKTLDKQNQTNCPIVNVICNKMCYCEKEYARNECGVCIPIKDCDKSTTTTTTAAPSTKCNASEGQIQLEQGNDVFTGTFLNEVVSSKNASTIMSPFSVLFPLAQLALYSTGKSLVELITALNLKDKDQIRCVFPQLISSYLNQKDVEFALAAKVFANENYKLSDAFLQDSRDIFKAEAQNVDFSKNQEAAAIINAWVEANTNNRIKDLVSPNMLSADTRTVLTNAIYFKGNWVKQFNPNNTKEKDFYITNDKTTKVKMMYQKGRFRYLESSDLDAKVLELPYKGNNFTFVAILPNDKEGLKALVNKLKDPNILKKAIDGLVSYTVNVYLPVMKITTTLQLTDILPNMGIKQMFTPNSGITGILEKPENVYVSTFIQKAFIEVNEVGSEAAAANAVIIRRTSLAYPPEQEYIYNADHPFVYFIRLGSIPFFCGTFVK